MNLRAAMARAARARLAQLEALAAQLENRNAVAELRAVVEEIGDLELGLSLLTDYAPDPVPPPSVPYPVPVR